MSSEITSNWPNAIGIDASGRCSAERDADSVQQRRWGIIFGLHALSIIESKVCVQCFT
jgi:hypothetical protein